MYFMKRPKQLFIACPLDVSDYRQISIVYALDPMECKDKLKKEGYDLANMKIIQVHLRGAYGKVYEPDGFGLKEIT